MSELSDFLASRDATFRNPTLETATAFWNQQGFPAPVGPDVPLGAIHKGRLQWLDATNEMIAESMKWLADNGYTNTMRGAPPLTPWSRDVNRVALGKKPLGDQRG